ncbi:MAG TPA: hypothetical protein PKY46_08680 [Ignavibacteriaceae bacterium]|nr:hypothetical protein [Ignavibacteriaceae bacterium]
MKKIFFILLLTHICLFAQRGTSKIDTFRVDPYQSIVMPQTPLVYFPARSFSFGAGNITVTDLTVNKTYRGSDVSSFQGKFSIDATKKIERYEDFPTNRNIGFPVAAYAEMTFFEPGAKYRVSLNPSRGCDNCGGEMFGNGRFLGNNEFIVEVSYPTPVLPEVLPPEFIFRQSKKFTILAGELRDPFAGTKNSYYSHKILLYKGGKTESLDRFGSYVELDDIFKDRENLKTDSIAIVGFYKGNPIVYKDGPARWSTKLTIPKNKLRHTTWGVDDKYRNEISEKNQADRLFKFAYGFVSGGEEIAISPGKYKALSIKCNGITPQYSDNLIGDYLEIEITNFNQSFKPGQDVEITISFQDSFDADWKYTFYAKIK